VFRKLIYEIDPLTDPRWPGLIARHSQASIFHTPEWLGCLHRTYGYTPIVYTSTPHGEELQNGLLFCRVNSWFTGRRLVSLPFSDHCEPLAHDTASLRELLPEITQINSAPRTKYIELRPLNSLYSENIKGAGLQESERFYHHRIDLRPEKNALFSAFHRDCVKRKIRRAEREGLDYRQGRSDVLLRDFYYLMLLTRRRHRLVPQPFSWFRNLARSLCDSMQVRAAYHKSRPVAAIVTLTHKNCMIYKYGCSDEGFSALGGTQMLFWQTIQEACDKGLVEFDLGRTEIDNTGLIAFKDRWGASRTELTYWRCPPAHSPVKIPESSSFFRQALARAPLPLLQLAGTFLYRHAG
ncbi:MAG: FemAB-related protein, system-associated, partial [Acidobacteria bacterium]|nr:FemAB-related protein, system-associated [Acidobacteriota bacterium]